MDKGLNLPKELLTQLNKAVELRNKAVHIGEPPPAFEQLLEILRAMEDVIWVCSLYAGYPWAGEFISYETKMARKCSRPPPALFPGCVTDIAKPIAPLC